MSLPGIRARGAADWPPVRSPARRRMQREMRRVNDNYDSAMIKTGNQYKNSEPASRFLRCGGPGPPAYLHGAPEPGGPGRRPTEERAGAGRLGRRRRASHARRIRIYPGARALKPFMKLRIEKAIYGGAGLARLSGQEAGKAIFVPETLPGEWIEAEIASDRRGFSAGALQSVLEPSPHRIQPGCEYFSRCGGCHYQHAAPAAQLQMKCEILRETLDRARLPGVGEGIGEIQAIASPPWAYRNRIRLQILSPVGPGGSGIALAYRRRGSHAGLPVARCPIAAPLLEESMSALCRLGKEKSLLRDCEEVELFSGNGPRTLLVSLWARGAAAVSATALRAFAEKLKDAAPDLAGVGVFAARREAGAGGRSKPTAGEERLLALWGEPYILYEVCSRPYRVSLRSFFQVNRFLLEPLQALVAGGRSGATAWDLYAGVGLFAGALNFDEVTAVESSPPAQADLSANAGPAGGRIRAVASTALAFLLGRRGKLPIPDLVVLDPPRAGLGPEIASLLAGCGAGRIVYVSCDPATLARDLQTILRAGYRVRSIHLADMFPQTFHLESVVELERT